VFLRIVRQIQSKGRSFLALKRLRVRNEYEDGRLSLPYAFEMVERRGIDSVALIPFRHGRERIWILIKAGFRPALFQRGLRRAPGEGIRPRPLTFEAVAGSLEPDEWTDSQIDRRALFELEEENGFRAKPAAPPCAPRRWLRQRVRDLDSLGGGRGPDRPLPKGGDRRSESRDRRATPFGLPGDLAKTDPNSFPPSQEDLLKDRLPSSYFSGISVRFPCAVCRICGAFRPV